jgi:hypothetical protein
MEALKERIRKIVDCGCCPVNETAVGLVAMYVEARGGQESFKDEELATIYEFEKWMQETN